MAKKASTELKLFFAWQSDLPAKFNHYAIKDGLKNAAKEILNTKPELLNGKTIIVDEATRDSPGSPNIPAEILKKIQAAELFVADVSIVQRRTGGEGEGLPNANVVYELGFAVANLGWERIILVMNETCGPVKALPFDFDRHRVTRYRLSAEEGSKGSLTAVLTEAIALILTKDPKRPAASKFNVAEAERQRDLTNVKWLLGSLHWPTIDHHIEVGPKYLTEPSSNFLEAVIQIVTSPLFHLYDSELRLKIKNFVMHWRNSVKYDHYVPMSGGRGYVFESTGPSSEKREDADWKYMQKERKKMFIAMNGLLDSIREKFPEIDISDESKAAGKRYDAAMTAIEKRFERPLAIPKKKKKRKH